MSAVRDTINAALKEAMLAKDNHRRDVIRLLQSAMKQVEIDTRKELTDDDAMTVLQREAKKRREAIDEANKAGRTDIADKEQAELVIKDKGKVMGALMAKVKGVAAGNIVNQAVQELLNG